jgi:SAM-dependent methyltransferase
MIEIRHLSMDNNNNIRTAYNQLYRETGILLQDSFYLWFIDLLKPTPGKLLLDVSCGQGQLVKFAQKKGITTIGMDFAEEAVYKALVASPLSSWAVANGEQLPLRDACVDYLTHIGSLEHYQNLEAGIREIARVLKPTGTAFVLLPNSYGLSGNIKQVLKTGDIFDDGQPLQRYNTRNGWHTLLAANGLTVFRTYKYKRVWPRTLQDTCWYFSKPLRIVRLFTTWLVPTNLANCFIFLCRRGYDA